MRDIFIRFALQISTFFIAYIKRSSILNKCNVTNGDYTELRTGTRSPPGRFFSIFRVVAFRARIIFGSISRIIIKYLAKWKSKNAGRTRRVTSCILYLSSSVCVCICVSVYVSVCKCVEMNYTIRKQTRKNDCSNL